MLHQLFQALHLKSSHQRPTILIRSQVQWVLDEPADAGDGDFINISLFFGGINFEIASVKYALNF